MMQEIMVALDGSDKGKRALSVALALAEIADTGVHLVRVVRPLTERILNQVELLGLDPKNAPLRRDAEEELVSIAGDLTMRSPRPVSWEVLEGSDVAVTIDRVFSWRLIALTAVSRAMRVFPKKVDAAR